MDEKWCQSPLGLLRKDLVYLPGMRSRSRQSFEQTRRLHERRALVRRAAYTG